MALPAAIRSWSLFFPTNMPFFMFSISLPWCFASVTNTTRQRPLSSFTSTSPPSGMMLAFSTKSVCPNAGSTFCNASFISFFSTLVLWRNVNRGYSFSKWLATRPEIPLTVMSCSLASVPKMPTAPWFSLCCVVSLDDWLLCTIALTYGKGMQNGCKLSQNVWKVRGKCLSREQKRMVRVGM